MPSARDEVVRLAVPDAPSACVPTVVEPSTKVMEPVGAAPLVVSAAVRVIGCPDATLTAEDVSVMEETVGELLPPQPANNPMETAIRSTAVQW